MLKPYFDEIKKVLTDEFVQANRSLWLVSSYFTDRSIFNLLCALARQGVDVKLVIADEPINLVQNKLDYSELLAAGGSFYLANRTPAGSLMHHKFCIIDEEKVITGSYNYTYRAQENRENILVISDQALAAVYKLELEHVISELSQEMQQWEPRYYPSGFVQLDRLTNGFYAGELICLAAKQGMGKTALATSMAYQMAAELKHHISFISADESETKLTQRLISIASDIPLTRLQKRNLEEYEWQLIHLHALKVESASIDIYEVGTLEQLETDCKKSFYKNVKLIIIDGTDHFIGRQEKDNDRSANALQRLKNLSRTIRIPILFTYTIPSNPGNRTIYNRRPRLEEIGQINDYADVVLFLNRDEHWGLEVNEDNQDTRGLAELIVAKNSAGDTGFTSLKFNRHALRFENMAEIPWPGEPEANTSEPADAFIRSKGRLDDFDDEPPF